MKVHIHLRHLMNISEFNIIGIYSILWNFMAKNENVIWHNLMVFHGNWCFFPLLVNWMILEWYIEQRVDVDSLSWNLIIYPKGICYGSDPVVISLQLTNFQSLTHLGCWLVQQGGLWNQQNIELKCHDKYLSCLCDIITITYPLKIIIVLNKLPNKTNTRKWIEHWSSRHWSKLITIMDKEPKRQWASPLWIGLLVLRWWMR